MPVQARYSARLGLVVLIGASMAALTGCGSLDGASSRIANIVKPYRVDVVRDRASLARIAEGGRLENVFRLQIMNATEVAQDYRISASGLEGLKMASDEVVTVGPAESRWVPVRVRIPFGASSGSHPIQFDISDAQGKAKVSEKAAFLVPR